MLGLRHYYKSGFTLMEALIVVITIGIILSFAVPAFINAKKRADDREARNKLNLIQTAVKSYGVDFERYDPGTPTYSCTNTTGCNAKYGLDLPVGKWNYFVSQHWSAPEKGVFCAGADKINHNAPERHRCGHPDENCYMPTRSWHIWGNYAIAKDCRRASGNNTRYCSTANLSD